MPETTACESVLTTRQKVSQCYWATIK